MLEERAYTREELKDAINNVLNFLGYYGINKALEMQSLAPMKPLKFPFGERGKIEIGSNRVGSRRAPKMMYWLNGDRIPIIEAGFGEGDFFGYLMFWCAERIPNYSQIFSTEHKNILYEKTKGSFHPSDLTGALEDLLKKLG